MKTGTQSRFHKLLGLPPALALLGVFLLPLLATSALAVTPNNLTELAVEPAGADLVSLWDTSAAGLRKNSVTNFKLAAVPRGYLGGMELAWSDTDTITITAGVCRDSTDSATIALSSAMTKDLGATWAAGDGANGLDTGAVTDPEWYHVFAIRKDSDGTGDVLFSASLTPTMPTGYTYYRRIGSVYNLIAVGIVDFSQVGDWFYWDNAIVDVNVSNLGATSVSYTLSVPTEVGVAAILQASYYRNAGVGKVCIRSPYTEDHAVDAATQSLATVSSEVAGVAGFGFAIVMTDTGAQVAARAGTGTTSGILRIATIGWIDRRGRDD